MGVGLAFIEMVTKLFIKNILAEMTDGDIAGSVFDLGKEIVTSIKGKKTPVELYNATFEKIVIKCIGESFETDRHDEEVAKALLETRLNTTVEDVSEKDLINLVYKALINNGVYIDNIDNNNVKLFLSNVSTALRGAVRNSSDLRALVTGDNVESIKNTVEEADRKNDAYHKEEIEKLTHLEELFEKYFAINRPALETNEKNLTTKSPSDPMRQNDECFDRMENWNAPMFLEEENKEIDLSKRTMEYVYVIPEYKNKAGNDKSSLIEYLKKNIAGKMHTVVFGDPGTGKSSLVNKLVSLAKKGELGNIEADSIYIYSFAKMSDIVTDWNSDATTVMNEMLSYIGVKYSSNLRGKVLFLDGFDEVACEPDKRVGLINAISSVWGEYCSVIITCRNGYIKDRYRLVGVEYIVVKPFNNYKIKEFVTKYAEALNFDKKNKLLSDTYMQALYSDDEDNVMGIPIILYMVLSMDIDVSKEESISDIYDHVFKIDGGIYDRMINSKRFGRMHRAFTNDTEAKNILHDMSYELAFWMFENDTEDCPVEECNNILKIVIKKYNRLDLSYDALNWIRGSFFRLNHLDGKKVTVRFVHRTMYEYFMALNLYQAIYDAYTEEDKGIAYLHERLVWLLKKGLLKEESMTFKYFKNKLAKAYKNDTAFRDALGNIAAIEACFNEMITEGFMSHYYKDMAADEKNVYQRIMESEANCFENFLKIVYVIRKVTGVKLLFEDNEMLQRYLPRYLKMKYYDKLRLDGFNLSGTDLTGIYMYAWSLTEAKFDNSVLNGVNLRRADMRKVTIINDSQFIGANLEYADIRGAVIEKCDFTNAVVANIRGDINIIRGNGNKIAGADFTGANKLDTQADEFIPGNLVEFGTYPQNADGKDSTPVLWRVLDIRGSYALLLSDKILDVRRYHDSYKEFKEKKLKWKDSDLNRRLNDYFINRLTRNEGVRIVLPRTVADECDVPASDIAGADENCDKIFLLSEKELFKYFARNGKVIEGQGGWSHVLGGKQAAAYATEYAKANKEDKHDLWVNDENQRSWWWLRSVGSGGCAMLVSCDGVFNVNGDYVLNAYVGVRPALWVNLKS